MQKKKGKEWNEIKIHMLTISHFELKYKKKKCGLFACTITVQYNMFENELNRKKKRTPNV